MDIQVLTILRDISWAGVMALVVYYIIKPLIEVMLSRYNPNGVKIKELDKRVNNELTHDVLRLNEEVSKLKEKVDNINDRLIRIETALKIKEIIKDLE